MSVLTRRSLELFCCAALVVGSCVAVAFAQQEDAGARESEYKRLENIQKAPEERAPGQDSAASLQIMRKTVEYTAEGFRDPFRSTLNEPGTPNGVNEVVTLPPMAVQGIIWGTETPQAILNEKVVETGDSIGEVRILEISKEGITVFYRSRNFFLPPPAAAYSVIEQNKGGSNAQQ